MSIHASILEKTFEFQDHARAASRLWNVESSISVPADKVRIFQALTVPEYVEAWLTLPGPNPGSLLASSPAKTEYRIDVWTDGGRVQRISGHYRVLRRSKLIFTWIKEGWPPSQSSIVWLRLVGDFSRTTVSLHHVALPSREEQFWHQRLWEASLEKLSSLFTSEFRFAN